MADFHPELIRNSSGKLTVLATEWLGGSDRVRGPGFYFYGRPFALAAGKLSPDFSRPVVGRRLLNSFFREISERGGLTANGTSPNRPLLWLRAGKTELIGRDPFLASFRTVSESEFEVDRVEVLGENGPTIDYPRMTLQAHAADGRNLRFTYIAAELSAPFEDVDWETRVERLGVVRADGKRRLLPPGYLDSTLKALTGKKIKLENLESTYEQSVHARIIWFPES
ncbi:MAG: hypothetical protein U0136_00695 [Bdellovibrionota bacterium]